MPQQTASPAIPRNAINSGIASPIPKPEWECPPGFATSTVQSWPASTDLLDKTGLPFCVSFHPLAETGFVCKQKNISILYFIYLFFLFSYRKYQLLTLENVT